MSDNGWIGVDFDGTLAYYEHWMPWNQFGAPLLPMVVRVKRWLKEGRDVRIVTARVRPEGGDFECLTTHERINNAKIKGAIEQWCIKYIGQRLEVTCCKDLNMIELWDDRAIQMIPNTGTPLVEAHQAELLALKGAP